MSKNRKFFSYSIILNDGSYYDTGYVFRSLNGAKESSDVVACSLGNISKGKPFLLELSRLTPSLKDDGSYDSSVVSRFAYGSDCQRLKR